MKTIVVRFQKEGLHYYTGAPEGVEFLKFQHRHMFHVEVEMEVFHDDRELEFILVKRDLEANFTGKLDGKSCEMICDDIHKYCVEKYCADHKRVMKISVFEDGENGARAYYE